MAHHMDPFLTKFHKPLKKGFYPRFVANVCVYRDKITKVDAWTRELNLFFYNNELRFRDS